MRLNHFFLSLALCFSAAICGEQAFQFGPFDDGMVTKRSPYNLAPTELSESWNVDYSVPGEIRCRRPFVNIQEDSVRARRVINGVGTGDFAISPAGFMAITLGDSLRVYYVKQNTPYIFKLMNNQASSNAMISPSVFQWQDGAIMLSPMGMLGRDTTNTLIYLRTAYNKVGLPTCGVFGDTADEVSFGTGNDTLTTDGTYQYVVTFKRVMSNNVILFEEEGNGTVNSVSTMVGSNYVMLRGIDTLSPKWYNSADPYGGTIHRVIYRSASNGSVLYKIGEINNNSDTTYIDTTSDAELNVFGKMYDEVKNNFCLDSMVGNSDTLRLTVAGACIHDNRIYAIADGGVNDYQITELMRTERFANQRPVFFNSLRKAVSVENGIVARTGLVSCGGRLYSLSLSGLSVIGNPESNTWSEVLVYNKPISGSNCVECVDNTLWILTGLGEIYSTSTGEYPMQIHNLTDSMEHDNMNVPRDLRTFESLYFPTLNVLNRDGASTIFATNGFDGTTRNYVYAGHNKGDRIAWGRWSLDALGAASNQISKQLLWIDSTSGRFCVWPSEGNQGNYNEIKDYDGKDSSAISLSFTTGWSGLGNDEASKQLERIVLDMDLTDTLSVYTYWDGVATPIDTFTFYSQDTILAYHYGTRYREFAKPSSIGKKLKLKFQQSNSGHTKIRFRNAKVYYTAVDDF